MAFSRYILDPQGEPISEPNLMKWAIWMQNTPRHIARNEDDSTGVYVSTVFLGFDYNYNGKAPILWETMIFGGEHDQYQDRYCSRQEALEGHKIACKLAGVAFESSNTKKSEIIKAAIRKIKLR